MKKLLFVAFMGALVACGETATETPAADTTAPVADTTAPVVADTTAADTTATAAT